MTTTPKSQQEYYDIGKTEIQARNDALTDFSDGSILDIVDGIASVMAQEITKLLVDKFKKTYFASAENQDLEDLAVDHFGDGFTRPEAQEAVGIVKFSRPNALAGNCTIPAGAVVKTPQDANGNSQRFETLMEVVLTGLTVNASVTAMVAGVEGNVDADTVTVIETALTDPSVTVNNDDAFVGGAAEETDAEYRQTIENKIQQLKGATLDAIESAALNVSGVEKATGIENVMTVIEWNEGTSTPIGDPFKMPRTKLYIADANGEASDALIALVEDAVEEERAAGVKIMVEAAVALEVDWSATITLNPAGPNYATLQTDTTMIKDSMREYIQDLAIGDDFNRALADYAMMQIWGPSGTNDLTDFQTSVPSGNISTTETQKLIPDVMAIV